MIYDEWISRERRIRRKLLLSSPSVMKTGTCMVCRECGEICLCHETTCPNCGVGGVSKAKIADVEGLILDDTRMRCRKRFECL